DRFQLAAASYILNPGNDLPRHRLEHAPGEGPRVLPAIHRFHPNAFLRCHMGLHRYRRGCTWSRRATLPGYRRLGPNLHVEHVTGLHAQLELEAGGELRTLQFRRQAEAGTHGLSRLPRTVL